MLFKRIFAFFFKTKATLLVFFLLIAVFFFLSSNFFIPSETLNQASFSLARPLNVFTYELIHIGPYHLASNVLTLLAFGIALELALSSLDVFIIFFASAVISGLFFIFSNPGSSVVGASGGILALITAAFFSSPKKFFMAVFAAIVFALMIFFVLNSALFSTQQNFEVKTQEIKQGIRQAASEGNFEKQKQLEQELEATVVQQASFEQSTVVEKNAVSDYASHVFAALFGIGYVFFFRRKKFIESIAQIDLVLHNIKKKIKRQ